MCSGWDLNQRHQEYEAGVSASRTSRGVRPNYVSCVPYSSVCIYETGIGAKEGVPCWNCTTVKHMPHISEVTQPPSNQIPNASIFSPLSIGLQVSVGYSAELLWMTRVGFEPTTLVFVWSNTADFKYYIYELSNKHWFCKIEGIYARFQVLMATSTKMAVFWGIAPSSLVEVYRRFRGACCLHHHSSLWRQSSSYLPSWEPEISHYLRRDISWRFRASWFVGVVAWKPTAI
jgi:hypothetical protein